MYRKKVEKLKQNHVQCPLTFSYHSPTYISYNNYNNVNYILYAYCYLHEYLRSVE